MESHVRKTNEPQRSFEEGGKERFSDRLKSLLNGRSVKQCSQDWGINLSTLKNYFSRPEAKPRFDVLTKISKYEGVSIEWLLGNEDSFEEFPGVMPPLEMPKRDWHRRLSDMLCLLDEDDLEALTKKLTLKGVETVLYLLDEDNIALLRLDKVVKEKILGKQPQTPQEADLNAQKARECDSVDEGELAAGSLVSDRRNRAS